MPKPLPPAVPAALNPPPSAAYPYRFFEHVAAHPLQAGVPVLSLRNAWWLMDAAFLAYSSPPDVQRAYDEAGLDASVTSFSGRRTTQCYVASASDWIVLAFRGTQVDDFCSSVADWTVDARFLPVPDSRGHLVHAGFLGAIREVWNDVSAHVLGLQTAHPRPLWMTGHSLGAALATLAASLCAEDPRLGLVGLHTYGSPRVGDRAFGRGLPVPVWRFRLNADLVTHLPPGFVFRHVGRLQFIDGNGHFHRDRSRADELTIAMIGTRPTGARVRRLSAWLKDQPSGNVPGFLADHAPINYAVRLWNCYEASGT